VLSVRADIPNFTPLNRPYFVFHVHPTIYLPYSYLIPSTP